MKQCPWAQPYASSAFLTRVECMAPCPRSGASGLAFFFCPLQQLKRQLETNGELSELQAATAGPVAEVAEMLVHRRHRARVPHTSHNCLDINQDHRAHA